MLTEKGCNFIPFDQFQVKIHKENVILMFKPLLTLVKTPTLLHVPALSVKATTKTKGPSWQNRRKHLLNRYYIAQP